VTVAASLEQELAALLAGVPVSASADYGANAGELCMLVDLATADDLDLLELLPERGLEAAFVSDRSHVELMGDVLGLKLPGLLVATLPWLYRVHLGRGFPAGYFARVFQHWMTAVDRCLAPDAAEPIRAVYRWILRNHDTWMYLAASPLDGAPVPGPWQAVKGRCLALLLEGAEVECVQLALASVGAPGEVGEFHAQVLAPALREIGRLWEIGRVSEAHEHRASAIARRVVDALFPLLAPPPETKGRVLVTAPSFELHDLGARILADLLTGAGWKVEFLGAAMPQRALLHLIKVNRPHVLALSLAMPSHMARVKRLIELTRQEPEFARSKVILGGNLLRNHPDLWRTLGADGYAEEAAGALPILDDWWAEARG